MKFIEFDGLEIEFDESEIVDSLKVSINVDITNKFLDWLCENAKPEWIAGRLLAHEPTRKCIIEVMKGADYFQVSPGDTLDDKLRREFLDAVDGASRADRKQLMKKVADALEVCEKYQRAYWDAYHLDDSNPDIREECFRNRVKSPEFYQHLEDPAHDWPSIRKELEEKVLAAFGESS